MNIPFLIIYAIALSVTVFLFILNKLYLKKNQQLNQEKQQLDDSEKRLSETQSELDRVQKEVEDKAEFEKLAGQIVAEVELGVVGIGLDGKVRFINKYAEKFLQDADVIGKSYKDILKNLKIDEKNDFSLFEEALRGKKQTLPDSAKFIVREENIPISATIIPLNGKNVVAFIFSDSSRYVNLITEEKAFFSVAVHELRTPLTAIRMAANLLLTKYDKLDKKNVKGKLSKIEETALQSLDLVNDFLNVSRIEQGRLEVEKTAFDIVALTEEVVKELLDLAKERKLYINHNAVVDSGNRKVLGDKVKAKEVLINLVSNAIKYTIQGGVTITHEESEGFIKTRVTDTGAGILPETAPLLFKRFGQTHAGKVKSSQKGTGLGLYISKKFAQLMEGDVILEDSKPNKGSTFTFSLPIG